jgi:hypothetical protein
MLLLRPAGLFGLVAFALSAVFAAPSAAQQGASSTSFHVVANARPPDAFVALRTQPSSRAGERILAMPNGTLLQVLQRRDDGWWYVRVHPSGQEGWALSGRGNRLWIHCCTTVAVSVPPPTPPQEELTGFRTPSNNVHCLIETWTDDDGKPRSQLRCDVMDISGPIPPKPADCEFDWGQVFAIAGDGLSGQRLCYSDSAMNDRYRVLAYGTTWRNGGYTCTSEPSAVTCVNGLGHGFALSRRTQRLF